MSHKSFRASKFKRSYDSDVQFESKSQGIICIDQSQKQQQSKFKYQDVINFKNIYLTNSLKTKQIELDNFIGNACLNVLFVFGPNGCGKKLLTQQKFKISYIAYSNEGEWVKLIKGDQQDIESAQSIGYVPLKDVILQKLDDKNKNSIDIFYDFPTNLNIKSQNLLQFKQNIYHKIKNTSAKVIFILNSQIYNPYYILNQSNSNYNLSLLKNIQIIHFNQYTKTQIKNILKHFLTLKPVYSPVQKNIKQISQFSNGDCRKALLQVYWNMIELKSKQQQSKKKKQKKISEKFSLFHLLGKYLYAKRLNTTTMQSQLFTQQYIQKYNPPFYFNPIQVFIKSRIQLNLFHDLIQQNYLDRFYAISDVVKMIQTFMLVDITFQKYELMSNNDVYVDSNRDMIVSLLTWGPLICNLNSIKIKAKGLHQFKKNQFKAILKQIINRKFLIKQYFPNSKIKDLAKFAAIEKEKKQLNKMHDICKILTKRTFIKTKSINNQQLIIPQIQDNQEYNLYGLSKAQQYFQQKRKNQQRLKQLYLKEENQENGSQISQEQDDNSNDIINNIINKKNIESAKKQ